MLGILTRYVQQLLDSVLAPVFKRILSWSWRRRVLVLLLIGAGVGVATYPTTAVSVTREARRLLAVWLSDPGTVPLDASDFQRVRQVAMRLSASLATDLEYAGMQGYEAWPIAQASVALLGISTLDEKRLVRFLESQMDASCHCWRQIPSAGYPQHIPASAWVWFALGEMSEPASPKQLKFILANQHTGGWWPVYPTGDQEEYASTYATAWAALALEEHLSKELVVATDTARVRSAVTRARGWLLSHREAHATRWKDYPSAPWGTESESISGFVMHVLRRLGGVNLQELDREWLQHLPASLPRAAECEQPSQVFINAQGGRFQDAICQLRLPWLLAATADAYPEGTVLQRVRALAWIERVLHDTDLLGAESVPANWTRAEILISLKHLLGED